MMKQNEVAQPIDVSSVTPIYNFRGDVVEWQVIVITKDVKFVPIWWVESMFAVAPRAKGNYSVSFNFDTEKHLAQLKYFFPEGLFKRGFNRAWDFRIEMLSQIAKNRNEKVK